MQYLLILASLLFLASCTPATRVSSAPAAESLGTRLERDVRVLSERYASRNAGNRVVLNASGDWIERRLLSMGYAVSREPVPTRGAPKAFNVVAELEGTARPDEIVVIGAHYDAEVGTP